LIANREFLQGQFADDDGSGGTQPRNNIGIFQRNRIARENLRLAGSGAARHVDIVLNRNRHTVQRPEQLSSPQCFLGPPRTL
jgi:hypothetical protein